ncbi:MAG: hypothetical protein LBQ82_03225 [Treponema sp.]|jgi:hypothetical protein|nr:hypothetical protein [Treponema sp.]
MKTIFRPVEFWKTAVMTMPDNSFFELLRSVFGKIKTPFKKQQMINDLETFLLRDDIQKTIAAYIDQNDAKVIAAVAMFGEPAPGELESFFSGELSYAQLQDIIVNLEERFILYRFIEKNASRLALNPVLEQVLLPFAADTCELLPAVKKSETAAGSLSAPKANGGAASLNDRILAGLLSFVTQEETFFRGEGVIRKRVIEAGKTCFPEIDLKLIIGGLQVLGLFYADGEKLVPDRRYFDDFGSLSARERMEYCAAALVVYSEQKFPTEIMPPLYRSKIRETVNFIHCLLDSLDAELLYPEKTLKRLTEVIKTETGVDNLSDLLLETLEKTGLLVTVSAELKQLGAAAVNMADNSESPCIAIDSGSFILVYPEISYEDAISLADFLNIREAGAVVRFELDKDSAVRAFDNNISADEIIKLLKRLSGGRVDDSFFWNLKDWEKRHEEVTLKKGVILSLSEDRQYLAETRRLAGLIDETLAPGLYLLSEDSMDDAVSALRAAGIDIIARCHEKAKAALAYSHFPSPSSRVLFEKIPSAANTAAKTENAAVLTENFHAILKKMPLGETDRAELSARIDRRLVLCEAQLKDASLRYEKLEARHMDYAGKQNIARQAIAQQSPVEIVTLSGKKTQGERIFGVPKTLEKEGGELILVIVSSEKEDVMRIPLGKISLLRRIKKSIFEV